MLQSLVDCLESIEVVATQIRGRDVDLLIADWMMIQTIREMEKKDTAVATVMAESLVARYVYRQLTNDNLLNLMKGDDAPLDDTPTCSLSQGDLI